MTYYDQAQQGYQTAAHPLVVDSNGVPVRQGPGLTSPTGVRVLGIAAGSITEVSPPTDHIRAVTFSNEGLVPVYLIQTNNFEDLATIRVGIEIKGKVPQNTIHVPCGVGPMTIYTASGIYACCRNFGNTPGLLGVWS